MELKPGMLQGGIIQVGEYTPSEIRTNFEKVDGGWSTAAVYEKKDGNIKRYLFLEASANNLNAFVDEKDKESGWEVAGYVARGFYKKSKSCPMIMVGN